MSSCKLVNKKNRLFVKGGFLLKHRQQLFNIGHHPIKMVLLANFTSATSKTSTSNCPGYTS